MEAVVTVLTHLQQILSGFRQTRDQSFILDSDKANGQGLAYCAFLFAWIFFTTRFNNEPPISRMIL